MAPDQKTLDYLQGRRYAPTGADWVAATEDWLSLRSDKGAVFDEEIEIDGSRIAPFVTWGTNPGQGVPLDGSIPQSSDDSDNSERIAAENALVYMDLAPGTPMRSISIDTAFIGSCTNSRIEDLASLPRS